MEAFPDATSLRFCAGTAFVRALVNLSFAVAQKPPAAVQAALLRHRNPRRTNHPSLSLLDNLVVSGIPPVLAACGETRWSLAPNFAPAGFSDWHPVRREQLIPTRFADVPQVHQVAMPGGARTQLTFFPDRVSHASYEAPPKATTSCLKTMSAAGNGSRFSVSIWEPVRSRCSPTEKAATWEWSGIRLEEMNGLSK